MLLKKDNQLYFYDNGRIEYITKYFLDCKNNLNMINCYNLLLCSAIFYEKEN